MNKGKICVSVCAKTADELIEQIKRAEDLADVIEIRFDCLEEINLETLWSKIKGIRKNFDGKFLATFRPSEQGGNRDLSLNQRKEFWRETYVYEFVDWGDFEFDFESEWNSYFEAVFNRMIYSFHNFTKTSVFIEPIYEQLAKLTDYKHPRKDKDVVKIAVQADDITDTIPVWKLLKKAKSENKQIIPIAMGEAGKWTRILGLAHGAFMTYAALDEKSATAPGQITAREMIDVYRVKKLDEQTEVYGVIGGDTSYSMSPFMHNAAFKFHGLNAVFVPLQVRNLGEFLRRMVKPETRETGLNFKGFAVTIPHKTEIIKYLDETDETAKAIGAVNTVKIEDGKLYGYNTDAHGFVEPLKNSYGDLKNARVAVLGAGGAARACVYALKKEGAEVTIFARNAEKVRNLAEDFQVEIKELPKPKTQNPKPIFKNFDIIVNTTPLGTRGALEDETPAVADQIKNVHLVYDLVYNPMQTRFLREAESVNVPTIGGLAMLVAQAIEQQKIWTGKDVPVKVMSRPALQKLQ